jgi:hypothetical protein
VLARLLLIKSRRPETLASLKQERLIMTNKFKLAWGGALLAVAGLAHADPFYLDVGTNYDPTGQGKVCDTCTSLKDQFTITYGSRTVVTDTDGSGGISVGDTTSTVGGFNNGLGGVDVNSITSLKPKQVFGTNSDNGFNTNYYITFSFSNLAGLVTGIAPSGLPIVVYSGGLIQMSILTAASPNPINFMNIKITTGYIDGVGTTLNGVADFTGISDLTYANLFHSSTYSCNGSTGFYDIWKNCNSTGDLKINFASHFDSDLNHTTVTPNADGTTTIVSQHNGQASFAIPEPASLALVGLSLVGLAGIRRRKNAA